MVDMLAVISHMLAMLAMLGVHAQPGWVEPNDPNLQSNWSNHLQVCITYTCTLPTTYLWHTLGAIKRLFIPQHALAVYFYTFLYTYMHDVVRARILSACKHKPTTCSAFTHT